MNELERKWLIKPNLALSKMNFYSQEHYNKSLKRNKASCDTLATPPPLECHILFEWPLSGFESLEAFFLSKVEIRPKILFFFLLESMLADNLVGKSKQTCEAKYVQIEDLVATSPAADVFLLLRGKKSSD